MKARELESEFEGGKDITDLLDFSASRRPLLGSQRLNVDLPAWMVDSLDQEASRAGVTRESIVKMWLAERLEQVAAER